MSIIDKNTVFSENQLGTDGRVFLDNEKINGKKYLFVGNSITRHGYKPDIGWYGKDYGMAASCMEKDYVHVLMDMIKKNDPDASSCICQVADWEREYINGNYNLDTFSSAREYSADVIIMRILENCRQNEFVKDIFKAEYKKLIDYLNPTGKAKIILTTSFWKHMGDEAIIEVGKENEYPTVFLGDLGDMAEMRADGLFEHGGVASHPGDKGMENIAKRIFDVI